MRVRGLEYGLLFYDFDSFVITVLVGNFYDIDAWCLSCEVEVCLDGGWGGCY
ncbi:MAG: hypothetical protein JWP69_2366, partial [Flaviaesturariibacter sp.]|nr:hypothetical protein [Flaviaesturariibacter sp.]